MSFTELFSVKVKQSPLVSLSLELGTLNSLFEELMRKLDQLEMNMSEKTKEIDSKADIISLDNLKDYVEKKIDELTNSNTMGNTDNAELVNRIKKIEDSLDDIVSESLIGTKNGVKEALEQLTPDLIKNIMNSIPNAEILKNHNKRVNDQLAKLQTELEDVRSSSSTPGGSSTTQDDLSRKIIDINQAIDQLKQKFAELSDQVKDSNRELLEFQRKLAEDAGGSDQPLFVNGESGEVDMSGILTRITAQERTIKMLMSRIDAIDAKESVSPSAFEMVTSLIRDLHPKIEGLENQTKNISDQMVREKDRVDKSIKTKTDNIDTRISENTQQVEQALRDSEKALRLIQKVQSEMSGFNTPVQEIDEPKKDSSFDELSSLVKNINNELAKNKENVESMAKKIDELSLRRDDNLIPEFQGIRREVTDLWSKFEQLTETMRENKDDFIPNKELLQKLIDEKTKALPIQRSTPLPKIQQMKIEKIDDSRLDQVGSKLDKQETFMQQIKRTLDQQQKAISALEDSKADKSATQVLFEQFRIAMGELNNRLGSVRKSLIGKADTSELHSALSNLVGSIQNTDTAAGFEQVKCIACGRPRTNVTGSMEDTPATRKMPPPTSTRIVADGEGQVCFVYGSGGEMFIGRSADGRSRYVKQEQSSAVPHLVKPL